MEDKDLCWEVDMEWFIRIDREPNLGDLCDQLQGYPVHRGGLRGLSIHMTLSLLLHTPPRL